jgi:hypothetical protein
LSRFARFVSGAPPLWPRGPLPATIPAVGEVGALLETERVEVETERPVLVGHRYEHDSDLIDQGPACVDVGHASLLSFGLFQPAGQIPTLGLRRRELERLAVGDGRFGLTPQAAEQVGARGGQQVVAGKLPRRFDLLHQHKPRDRPFCHPHRDRPVQLPLAAALPFGLAFGAGMVAAVNPCGFAMLPAYLSLYLGAEEEGFAERSAVRRALRALLVGLTVSMGFVAVIALAGAVISAGGTVLIGALPVLGVLVGEALIVIGLWLFLGGRSPYIRRPF